MDGDGARVQRLLWASTSTKYPDYSDVKYIDDLIGMDTWAALQLMDRDGVNQLPVVADGRVVGMLSREDAITFLRTVRELGA